MHEIALEPGSNCTYVHITYLLLPPTAEGRQSRVRLHVREISQVIQLSVEF